jgi:membrane protease subunit HflK
MAWNEPGPGRDPWNQGGKRDGGAGPDLDEMLKRLKARFAGRGRGGGGGSVPAGVVLVAVIALLLMWSLTGWYMVDEQERGVVLRLGRVVDITEPGPHLRLPWPIDTTEIVNVTGVRTQRDTATVLTQDLNIVALDLSVQYRVRLDQVREFVFNVSDPDKTLQQAITASVREVVGSMLMDDVLTNKREEVADKAKQLLQARLDEYRTGLVVTEVNLQQAQPPEAVQAAFADAIKAGEDYHRVINEAEAYKKDRLPRAGGEAARKIAEANAYREQVIARAEGDASRFTALLGEYKKAPAVTRERLYLDAIGTVLGNNSKVLVDVDKGGPMFYLPLDELLKNAKNPDAGSDYPGANGAGARAGSGGSPPYDPSRSRERGR